MIKKNSKEVGFVYKSILPSGYQRIEYIESTGSGTGYGKQYIDTGYIPNSSGFKVNIVFGQSSGNNNTGCFVYGAYSNADGYKPSLYIYASTRKMGVYFNTLINLELKNMGINTNIVAELDKFYDVTITTSGANVDYNINGTTGTITTAYSQLENNNPLVLFTSYVGNTYILRTKIKRFRVWDNNDILVRDMIPCYRESDGKGGMYDIVNNVFYAGQGSEDLEQGFLLNNVDKIYSGTDLVFEQGFVREQQSTPPITTTKQTIGKDLKDYKVYGNSGTGDLPDEYQQVEYIQSDGTQYINTGLEGKNGYTFETKVRYVDIPNNYSYLAGFGTSSSNRIYFVRGQKSSYTDGWTFDGDSHNISSVSIVLDTEYVYKSIMETGNQELYRNGTLLDSATRSDTNAYGNIWLFATDYNHSPNGAVAVKMYYAKFTYGGDLVRDFVPCYRKSDNVAGMYDKITKTFYSSIGSNDFAKGADVYPSPEEPIQMLSVGDKSKNMLNLPQSYTFTGYPNVLSLADKFEVGVQYRLSWTKAIKGSTYQPSINLGGGVGWVNYLSANGGSKTFTYTSEPTAIYIYANGSNASQSVGVTSTIEGLMITKATEDTTYEPYGYKIPVIASSKNLLPYPYPATTINGITFFSTRGKLKINGTASSTFWGNVYTFDLPAGEYTFVEKNNIGAVSGHSIQLGVSGTPLLNVTVESSRTNNFTLYEKSTITMSFRFTSGTNIQNEELELMIIKRGDNADFSIYSSPITTNIYLDEPIRKIGNKVDYIDFKNKKVVRKIKEYVIPSNYSVANVTKYTNTLLFSSMNVLTGGQYGITNKKSNFLPCLDVGNGTPHIQGVNNSGTKTWLYVYVNKSSIPDYTDELTDNELISALRTLLRGISAKVWYELETETQTSITLPAIPSIKRSNTVYSIGSYLNASDMYIKYKGK